MPGTRRRSRMNLQLSLVMWSGVLQVAILALLAPAGATNAPQGELANLNISLTLVRSSDGSSKPIKGDAIALIAQRVPRREGDSIEGLLTSHGVLPDGESLGAVYAINPQLDAKAVMSAVELVLPKATGGTELSRALEEGYLVALTLDTELKRQLLMKVKVLTPLAQRMATLEPHRFEIAKDRDTTVEAVRYVAESLRAMAVVIRERNRPLSSEMLRQVICEADVLGSLLNNIDTRKKLSRADAETVVQIMDDFKVRMNGLNEERGPGDLPPKWPEGLVSVRIQGSGNREEVHGLRVYYVPQALWKYRHKYESCFDKLSSPTEQSLPEATYSFWAGKPGDSTPLSDIMNRAVRQNETCKKIEVQIVTAGE